jgi:Zn-dependent M28 family amino/carboxypeptidase
MRHFILTLVSFITLFSIPSVFAQGNDTDNIVDTASLRVHLKAITKTANYRNHKNHVQLDAVAKYIYTHFSAYADTTYYQPYSIGDKVYRNVVAVFGSQFSNRTVVGAHYDVCGDQEGADDNASGVVGLLKLAEMLQEHTLNTRIELVAFTLEEPPFFRTDYMGSAVHAKSLVMDSVQVDGMICLEMIGYFDDTRKSQRYPIGLMKAFYGSRGNYIALVSHLRPGRFVKGFMRKFEQSKQIKTKRIKAPKSMTGIDFSDHLNYWKYGIPALMITDTAFYRNGNYHERGDTLDTLDLNRMADVIQAVFQALTAQ